MQGFLLFLALLTAQNNGADLSKTRVSVAEGQVVVSWSDATCPAEDHGCFVFTDRVGTKIETEVYNGASSGTRYGMLHSVRQMARLLGDYTGWSKHKVGRTHGRVVIESWEAHYRGGSCAHVCSVVIYRTWHDGRWHWGSEVG